MHRTNQDVVGDKWIWNDAGELSPCDDKKLEGWVEHYYLPPVDQEKPGLNVLEKILDKTKPGVAYPEVCDTRNTLNTKIGW